MSIAIQSLNQSMTIWDDNKKLEEIRKLFAPKLTDLEFQFFVGLGKATGLNPFTREIWAVKYGKDKDGNELPAQVFIGRDGYRKAAQAHIEYDYHQSDAVYENDKFEVVEGQVRHAYSLKDRGKLIGAYCIAKRHKSSRPIYVFADLEEYSTGQSLWADPVWKDNKYGGKYKQGGKPATMIKKVAESQCLRACFQDLLGGTYGEEEMSEPAEQSRPKSEGLMDKLKAAKNITIDVEPIAEEEKEANIVHNTGSDELSINQDQMNQIEWLMFNKNFDNARIKKALDYFKVSELNQLTDAQARLFLLQLGKA